MGEISAVPVAYTNKMHISPTLPQSMLLFWTSWRTGSFVKRDRVFWDLLTVASFWSIWKERNNRIFNNLARSPDYNLHVCSHWSIIGVFFSGKTRDLVRTRLVQPSLTDESYDLSEEVFVERHEDDDVHF